MKDWNQCPVCHEPTAGVPLRLAVVFRRQRCAACGSALRGRADAWGWRIAAAAVLMLCLVLMVVGVLPQIVGWPGVLIAASIALAPELLFALRPDRGDPITVRAIRRAENAAAELEPPVSIEEHREKTGR